MSLDLKIADEQYNYTYNVSKMWYEIFPEDDGMVQIEGLKGKKAKKKLKTAVEGLIKHEDILRKYEPENSWGSYNGFLSFLIELLGACDRHPTLRWKAYR